MSGRVIKRVGAVFGVLLLLLGVVQLLRPLPTTAATNELGKQQTVLPSQPDLAWASYGGQAIEVQNQGLEASHGDQSVMPTASLAKLMTVLAILHKYPFVVGDQGQTLTLTDADVNIYQQDKAQDESVVPVVSGEQITEYQALQAILLPSACNMADSAAIWAFGSMQQYLDYANQEATTLGMTHTHFAVDASGASIQTVSTPQDLLRLGEAAVAQSVIMNIVSQTQATIPEAGTIYNYNAEIGRDGIIGLKTGNNDADHGAFLFAAQYDSQTILGVTMGASTLTQALRDSVTLLKSAQANLQQTSVVKQGQRVAQYRPPWGSTAYAAADKDLTVLGWKGTKLTAQLDVETLKGTGRQGQTIGSVKTAYGGHTVSVPVKLQSSLPGPSFIWRLTRLS